MDIDGKIYLKVLSKQALELIREEKNEIKGSWRTSFLLTKEMQEDYYNNIICNRLSNNRIFGVHCMGAGLVGTTGISHIEWENRIGEITMFIMDTGKGYGRSALKLILKYAFEELNLKNVYGECYECNPSIEFWKKMKPKYTTMLPDRKYFNGQYWDSLYFNFSKDWLYNESIN